MYVRVCIFRLIYCKVSSLFNIFTSTYIESTDWLYKFNMQTSTNLKKRQLIYSSYWNNIWSSGLLQGAGGGNSGVWFVIRRNIRARIIHPIHPYWYNLLPSSNPVQPRHCSMTFQRKVFVGYEVHSETDVYRVVILWKKWISITPIYNCW